jgi:hypothetical protein
MPTALSRPESENSQDTKAATERDFVRLMNIIGPFDQTSLGSMARDIGKWTGLRCPRGWFQTEGQLVNYVLANEPLLRRRWDLRAFTVQRDRNGNICG